MGCFEHHRNRLSVVIEAHLTALIARKYSPKSIAIYRHGLGHFTAFLEARNIERFQDVDLADLEAFRVYLARDKDFAPATLEQALRAVRQLFRWLEDRHELFSNPADRFIIPQPKRKLLPVPSEDEVRRLLAAPDLSRPVGIRDRALMETLYSTGLRLQEVQQLEVLAPDLQQQRLRVMGKGKKERVVPLGRQAVHWLRQYIKTARPKLLKQKLNQQALWIGLRGHRLGMISISKLVHQYGDEAGLSVPVSPHALRRACATHMLARGAHPVQIQMLLGHASLDTLGQYLRVSITDLRKAHRASKPGR